MLCLNYNKKRMTKIELQQIDDFYYNLEHRWSRIFIELTHFQGTLNKGNVSIPIFLAGLCDKNILFWKKRPLLAGIYS